ncbi:hypothetical protein [Qipengyuania nanhaisediminis]|uniref:hypothetical protein n=1 Tax=Qipengyuania nanhaisediminis TaxID=604088 RepID=UPI0038B3462D
MLEFVFSETRPYLQDIVAWALCLAALAWGGAPERLVAATWIVVFEIGTVLHGSVFGLTRQLETIDWYFAGADIFAGAVFIGVALNANRNYTLWIAALQLLAVVAHVSRGITEVVSPIAYAVMIIAPGWIQLFLLGVGLTRHVLRKRRHGEYRDWRISRKAITDRAQRARDDAMSAIRAPGADNWRRSAE